jgi:hypothetical protein
VDINPFVAHTGQKKPKGLLRAVWEQVCLEGKGQWADAFAACAYDGRRNAFTPIEFPIPEGVYHFTLHVTNERAELMSFHHVPSCISLDIIGDR